MSLFVPRLTCRRQVVWSRSAISSVAASPGSKVVIQGLLYTLVHLDLVSSTLLFAQIGEHFAISMRGLVNNQLRVARLFEFLDLPFQFFPELLELLHLSIRGLKI